MVVTSAILIRDSSTTQLLTLAVSIINFFVHNIFVKFCRCVYRIAKVLGVYVSSQSSVSSRSRCTISIDRESTGENLRTILNGENGSNVAHAHTEANFGLFRANFPLKRRKIQETSVP